MKFVFFTGFLIMQITLFGCSTDSNASDLIREQKLEESPQWVGDSFQNPEPVPTPEWGPSVGMIWDYFFNKSEGYIPKTTLPMEPFDVSRWERSQNLQLVWLGHTTVLIQLEEKVILTDPIFSQRAGSFGLLSPKRYSQYFSLEVFKKIIENSIFFISRLKSNVTIFLIDSKTKLDLLGYLKKIKT